MIEKIFQNSKAARGMQTGRDTRRRSRGPDPRRLVVLLVFSVLVSLAMATSASAGTLFTNPNMITIPGSGAEGPAEPYPSKIFVSGMSGPITDVNVTLHRVGHTFPADIGVLLVSPSGDTVKLMQTNCHAEDIEDFTWIFDQQSANLMPLGSTSCPDFVYRPNPGHDDSWPAPAPPGPHGVSLDDFDGETPNGTWSLYVADFGSDDTGDIEGGWSISIETGPVVDMTFFVNATDDQTDRTPGNGICDTMFFPPGNTPKCTLRAAIQETNAASGADTIILPAGEYTLTIPDATNPGDVTVGDLDITDDLTINGAGARTTSVVGGVGFDDGIFRNGMTSTTTIRGLTVTRGKEMSILNSFGDLRLRRVAVIANKDGGVGGNGTLTITDSTVSNNLAGGIAQFGGTTNIINTTVSGNQSAGFCGGICALRGSTINIQSSTIANNSSPGPGSGILSNGVDEPNGVGSLVNVKNTIVSGNSSANCSASSLGTITSQGNNIDSANSCGFAQTTDKPDTDPSLALLANNGGPTDTHALLSRSPAIDSGDSNQAADQRGVSRPQNGDNNASVIDDIGAFERNDPVAPRITATAPGAGATGVRRAANLSATFSESMGRATLNRSTFKLYRVNADGTMTQITNVTVGSTADGLKAVLNPLGATSTVLAANTRYRAVVTVGAKDWAGNGLDQDPAVSGNQAKAWTFTTGAS